VDPLVLLASVGARTQRIGLATGVYLLPLRSPASVARSFASLDYISDGRAILGIGVGGEFEEDFLAAGIPMARRGERADAQIALLHELWKGEPVDWSDDFFNLRNVQVLPRPVQRDIPIIAGGRSEAALRRAATVADGWMPYLMAPERIAAGIERMREFSDRPHRVVAHVFVSLGANRADARRLAIESLSKQYGQDMERVVDRCVPVGPADAVAEDLARLAEAGATDIVLRLIAPPEDLLMQLESEARVVRETLMKEWT